MPKLSLQFGAQCAYLLTFGLWRRKLEYSLCDVDKILKVTAQMNLICCCSTVYKLVLKSW